MKRPGVTFPVDYPSASKNPVAAISVYASELMKFCMDASHPFLEVREAPGAMQSRASRGDVAAAAAGAYASCDRQVSGVAITTGMSRVVRF